MIVVAVFSILGSLAVIQWTSWKRTTDGRTLTRRLIAHLAKARQLATSGRSDTTDASWPQDALGNPLPAINAGLEVTGPQSYRVFVDSDRVTNGNESAVDIIDWGPTSTSPKEHLSFPSGVVNSLVRFGQQGTVTNAGGIPDLVLVDTSSNKRHQIAISVTGIARVK